MEQDIQPPHKVSLLDKLRIRFAAVDEDTLRECPHDDWENVRRVAEIMICVWIYQTTLFSIIAHRVFSGRGQFRPEMVSISAFLATFILLIDSYNVIRSSWNLLGIEGLKRCGLDISGGSAARIKANVFLAVRILLAVGTAQLSAIFLGILFFSSDIDAPIQKKYVEDNAGVIAAATSQVDGQIKQLTDAVNAEDLREAALASQVNALRQDRIDPSANRPEIQQANQEIAQFLSEKAKADEAMQKAESFASDELGGIKGSPDNSGIAGDGPKRRAALEAVENARNSASKISTELDAARARLDALRKQSVPSNDTTKQQSEAELPKFEADLAAEDGKVKALRDDLDRRTEHRQDAIRAAVEASPNHIPAATGLLTQITALEHLAEKDKKIGLTIVLIDLVSFGLELAAVLVKVTSYAPTYYAMLLARNVYMRGVHLVDGMVAEINRGSGGERDTKGRGPDPFGTIGDPPPADPKRPRGRPPKSPFNGKIDRPLPFDDGLSPTDP